MELGVVWRGVGLQATKGVDHPLGLHGLGSGYGGAQGQFGFECFESKVHFELPAFDADGGAGNAVLQVGLCRDQLKLHFALFGKVDGDFGGVGQCKGCVAGDDLVVAQLRENLIDAATARRQLLRQCRPTAPTRKGVGAVGDHVHIDLRLGQGLLVGCGDLVDGLSGGAAVGQFVYRSRGLTTARGGGDLGLQQARGLVGGDFHEGVAHVRRQLTRERGLAGAQLCGLASVSEWADDDPALGHSNAGFVGLGGDGVVGATQPDGGQGGVEAVLVLGGLPAFARDGAAGALLQIESDAAGLGLVFVVSVGADDELAFGAQGDKGVVHHAQVQVGVGLGLNLVTHINGVAGLHRARLFVAAQQLNGAVDEGHMPGDFGLRVGRLDRCAAMGETCAQHETTKYSKSIHGFILNDFDLFYANFFEVAIQAAQTNIG